MQSNKKAFLILAGLVFTSLLIFCAEKKFLVAEKRGSALGKYEKLPWKEKILLLVEDFEGISADTALKNEKFFSYGSVGIRLSDPKEGSDLLSGETTLEVEWKDKEPFGGWGKGVGENLDLDAETAYLNFRIYIPASNGQNDLLKITLEEDDNDNGVLEKEKDDSWSSRVTIPAKDRWQLISIPLKDFTDDSPGGDDKLNISRKGGLHTLIFSFTQPKKYKKGTKWYFDFIFFSSGPITDSQSLEHNLN